MSQDFRLLMLGAMYENGGNTTHRFLDGHPELFVYPFESQIGTRHVQDALASTFPTKYRWPVFQLDATPAEDYHAIIDEEGKVRARTPHVSKFRDWPFDFSDDDRKRRYVAHVERTGRSRAANVAAFFRATFEAWKDHRTSGRETVYVGYSPIIVVDAAAILRDLPQAHVLHVVRNPWSAYADTCKRPVPLSLAHYLLGWTLNQYYALLYRDMFPGRLHVVRAEDVMADPVGTLGAVLGKLGLGAAESLRTPTWNGTALTQVYPWGTIRIPTPEANRATALELPAAVRDEVRARAWQYLETFDYKGFL
jgi:sulfotransferase family protein